MKNGVAHLLLIVIIAIVLIALPLLALKYVFKKNIPIPGQKSKDPQVAMVEQYNNPLKKESQYVNPFDQSKSPFLTLNERNNAK